MAHIKSMDIFFIPGTRVIDKIDADIICDHMISHGDKLRLKIGSGKFNGKVIYIDRWTPGGTDIGISFIWKTKNEVEYLCKMLSKAHLNCEEVHLV